MIIKRGDVLKIYNGKLFQNFPFFTMHVIYFFPSWHSGLDSSSSLHCVTLLREIARSGRTVNIHLYSRICQTASKMTKFDIGYHHHPSTKFAIIGLFWSFVRCCWWIMHVPRAGCIFSTFLRDYELELS